MKFHYNHIEAVDVLEDALAAANGYAEWYRDREAEKLLKEWQRHNKQFEARGFSGWLSRLLVKRSPDAETVADVVEICSTYNPTDIDSIDWPLYYQIGRVNAEYDRKQSIVQSIQACLDTISAVPAYPDTVVFEGATLCAIRAIDEWANRSVE
jgi:hypothetical protein